MEKERQIESSAPPARVHKGYLVGNFATGWYFPGELTQRPRISVLRDEESFLSEDELARAIEEGLAREAE